MISGRAIILLPSASVAVITSKPNREYIFTLTNHEIYRTVRFSVVRPYASHTYILPRTLGTGNLAFRQLATNHREEKLGQIVSLFPAVFVFPKTATNSFVWDRRRAKSLLHLRYPSKLSAETVANCITLALTPEHFDAKRWTDISTEYSGQLHAHPAFADPADIHE